MIDSKTFDIKYVKLHYTVEFFEDASLPVNKTSALRGGMGEMLLRSSCVKDRDCESCEFESECIVRRIMYSKMEIQPSFMTSGDSVGYVIECEDYRDSVSKGDTMRFNLLIFGKTICYFSNFLNAFYSLGVNGIGKESSHFKVISVTNSKKQPILDGLDVHMDNLEILKVSDYVAFRRKQIADDPIENRIKFKSPLSIKYRGEKLEEFIPKAIIESACRRLYMLDCFEGIESNVHDLDFINSIAVPEVISEDHKEIAFRRYSNHKESPMYLKGIEGELVVDSISDELLDILLAGELIHIGKNTSFGFGRYRIS